MNSTASPRAYTVKNERGEFDPYFLRQYDNQSFEIHCDRDNPEWIALYQNDKQVAIATLKTQYAEAVIDKRPGEDAQRHAEREKARQLLSEEQVKYGQILAETGTKLGFQFQFKDLLNSHESTLKMALFEPTAKLSNDVKQKRKSRRKEVALPALLPERRGMSEDDLFAKVLNSTSNNYTQ